MDLVVRTSQIPNAGMGLYYLPLSHERDDNDIADVADTTADADVIAEGSVLCFYTGHVHTHSSSREIEKNDRSYLMWIRGNTLVDPGPLPYITARYINDPLNEILVNCRYVSSNLSSSYHSYSYVYAFILYPPLLSS